MALPCLLLVKTYNVACKQTGPDKKANYIKTTGIYIYIYIYIYHTDTSSSEGEMIDRRMNYYVIRVNYPRHKKVSGRFGEIIKFGKV